MAQQRSTTRPTDLNLTGVAAVISRVFRPAFGVRLIFLENCVNIFFRSFSEAIKAGGYDRDQSGETTVPAPANIYS
jgi:hypothetical protein